MSEGTLNIAEILDEQGNLKQRYALVLSADGTCWIRHGRFEAYHANGKLASEGEYHNGAEHGPWKDYHLSGELAAEGNYAFGEETGEWRFFDAR